MGLFDFFTWVLIIMISVSLLWPVNAALVALAYKVYLGIRPNPLETRSFVYRSIFAGLGTALMGLVVLGLNAALVDVAELPPGPIRLILFMLFVPAGAWYFFWMLALEDMLQGLGVFLLYNLLPALPLLLWRWLFAPKDPISWVAYWFIPS